MSESPKSAFSSFKVHSQWSSQELEKHLCEALQHYDFIGQIPLEEEDFKRLADIMRSATVRKKKAPLPATFVTAMVFCARYSKENARFWKPFRETVMQCGRETCRGCRWCNDLFVQYTVVLHNKFGFEFPTRPGYNEVVRPVYYHALIPAYLQDDFARWLAKKHASFNSLAKMSPQELARELRKDTSLKYVARRLATFLRGEDTQDAAVHLIQTLAKAARLYETGESAEDITKLLTTPIKRELWQEMVRELEANQARRTKRTRKAARPRLEWVWEINHGEIALRLAGGEYEERPVQCRWLAGDQQTTRDMEIYPWPTPEGSWRVDEVLMDDVNVKREGLIELLDAQGHVLYRESVPPFPFHEPLLPFRLTQQGTLGVLVDPTQCVFSDGEWLLCLQKNVRLDVNYSDDGEYIPEILFEQGYERAYIADLHFPFDYYVGDRKYTLRPRPANLGQPHIVVPEFGAVPGLASHVPPTFTISEAVQIVFPPFARKGSYVLALRRDQKLLQSRPLYELSPRGEGRVVVRIGHLLNDQPGQYEVDVFRNLRSVLHEPLRFNIIPPHVVLDGPDPETYYYTSFPPTLTILGIPLDDVLIDTSTATKKSVSEGKVLVTWHHPKLQEGRVALRFGDVVIPLVWPLKWTGAWVEGIEHTEHVTFEQMEAVTLHIRGERKQSFLWVLQETGAKRLDTLNSKGRFDVELVNHPLFDMLRKGAAQGGSLSVNVQIGEVTQHLFTLWSKPQLDDITVNYICEGDAQALWVQCPGIRGEKDAFTLQLRSLHDRDKVIPLTTTGQLEDVFVEGGFSPGYYRLEILYDAELLEIPADKALVTIDAPSVQFLSPDTPIEPGLLLEWLTWPLERLQRMKLDAHSLLRPLAAVHNKSNWLERHGLLPAWAVTGHYIAAILITMWRRVLLPPIVPQLTFDRATQGKGFTELKPYYEEHKPLRTYVRWGPGSEEILLKIPDKKPEKPFAALEEDELRPIYMCQRCHRFFGSEYGASELDEDILRVHTHGTNQTTYYDVVYGNEITYNLETRRSETSRDKLFEFRAYVYPDPEKPLRVLPQEYHPRQYANPIYTEMVLAHRAKPPTETYSLASPEHYRFATYAWGMRYALDPRAFQNAARSIALAAQMLQDSIAPRVPAHAAYLRFSNNAFPEGIYANDPRLALAPSVLLLAVLLRSEAYQVASTPLSEASAQLLSAVGAAYTFAPELFAWALMWAEIFFEHAV